MKVRDILVEHKQGYYKPGEFETGDIHLVRISDITNEAHIDENTTPMVNVDQAVLENFDVKKNDFLFARTGGAGRFALIKDDVRGIFASYLIRFRFMPEYDPSFLRYYFLSDSFQSELKSTIHGGVNQNIHAENIKDCSVPIFSLPEQQRIVSMLDEAFESIAQAKSNAERNLVNARELFDSVVEEIFNDGEYWEEKLLGEVCSEIFAGGDVPKDRLSKTKTAKYTIPIFANGEKNKGLYGYTNLARVTVPSVTVSARGTIGYSEIRKEPFYPAVRLIVITPNLDVLDLSFLQFAIKNIDFKHSGVSIPQLTVPMIKEYSIPLPPLPEQRTIVGRLEALSTETKRLEGIYQRKVESLEELKKSVLQKAFAGEL